MPPLPKEEAKIIVRPRGGLCISKVGPTAVADTIWQAAGLDSATRDTDTMCPNFQQNIMVISTPNKQRCTLCRRSRSRERSRSRGRTRSRTVSRSRSGSRVRYKSRSRSGSRGRQGSRAQPSSGPQSSSTGCGRQPTLVWADLVRPKPGANTWAAPAARNDPPPEQARDAEVIRLRKANDDLKNTINRLVNEMADIKKLVSNASDDFATGADSAVEAERIIRESQTILEIGGVNLIKCRSNHTELIASLAETESAQKPPAELGHTKIIGVDTDKIVFEMHALAEFLASRQDTKRSLLQASAHMFDPFRFLLGHYHHGEGGVPEPLAVVHSVGRKASFRFTEDMGQMVLTASMTPADISPKHISSSPKRCPKKKRSCDDPYKPCTPSSSTNCQPVWTVVARNEPIAGEGGR
ncbi:hypothetical protein HPB49_008166 [Dermacentor silvarum]|uniref:Uncharacterized protein n=1 Tax=Dermacentor silvarum TaxID=543639 RepID=A0ACB8CDZ9_DERSI|nr:hypothetical protein HPB49_008166 [Dermacentor silvarum]